MEREQIPEQVQEYPGANWQTVRQSPWLVLAGVTVIACGQAVWFQDITRFFPGGWLAITGVIMVMLALRSAEIVQREDTPSPTRRVVFGMRLALAALGIVLCYYTSWRAINKSSVVWDSLILWSLSILLTAIGLVPPEAGARWWRGVWHSLRRETGTWLLVLALFGLGLVLRVAWLETMPDLQAGDEAQFAYEAASIKDEWQWTYSPFEMGFWHHPRTVHVLLGVSIDLFGQTKTGARMPSAILGALTVPAVFLAGRRLFDRRVGVIAALFMATFPMHIQFSRTGMDQTGDPLFGTLAFAFLAQALREDDAVEGALAGLCMGLTQYFYFAGKIFPLLLLGYAGLWFLRDWRLVMSRLPVLVITLVVSCVVVFPGLHASHEDTERPVSPRLNQVAIWKTGDIRAADQRGELPQYWATQIRQSYMAYLQVHDESDVWGRYNPVLGWFAGVPFLVGVGVILRRWRDPGGLILLVWIIGTATLGGMLLIDPPHYPRYVSATPALAMIVALGLVGIGLSLLRLVLSLLRLPGRVQEFFARYGASSVPLLLAILLSGADQTVYIVDYVPQTDTLLYGEATVQLNDVVEIVDSLEEPTKVWYFSSLELDLFGTDLLDYRVPQVEGEEYRAELSAWEEVLWPGRNALVIAPARYAELRVALHQTFPEAILREYTNERTQEPLVFVLLIER
ncbi:MAG: hypothetical protein GYB65_12835 [Chloroflexi bacterium]|nr:hypothetical protein [Chloroflexota bacterium]